LKFLSTIITGAIVGALVVYFTLDWQEEKLIYSITTPAKFGEINYQNVTLTNTGWNPAVNIKLFIEHPNINFSNAQAKTSLKDLSIEKNGIASIERVRRNESVVISLAYKGQPLFGTEITISSDRSIAELVESEGKEYLPVWATLLLAFFGITFFIGLLSAITIPAYKDYVERAKKAKATRQNAE
jgi:hypothetical protein